MKKIFLAIVSLMSFIGASAITMDEAFDQVAAMPGAAVSDMPKNDALKDAFEYGKVVFLMGQPSTAADAIVAEITDEKFGDMEIDGHSSSIYQKKDEAGNTTVFILTRTPMGPMVMIAKGKGDVLKNML